METKNSEEMIRKELPWLKEENNCIVPPHSPGGGGLILSWKKDIDLTVLSTTDNFIETRISSKGKSFLTTFLYGEPDHTKRNAVWNELTTLHANLKEPWFLTGDFNELQDNSEKKGGPERAEGTFGAFRTFLSENDLFDLKHSGNPFSWRGKRGAHLVRCRLDRAMSNPEWMELFPSCRCQYLKFEGSDHRPILSYLDTTRKKGHNLFRYDRRLQDQKEIKELVAEIWQNCTYLGVEARLVLVRRAICKWCKLFQENSKQTIENLRVELDDQMTKDDPDEDRIQDINKLILKAYNSEEAYWKQRSRLLWLTLGDSNSGYFHAVTKTRKARNRLTVMENKDGIPVYEEDQISALVCSYYDNLFTANQRGEISSTISQALKPCVTQEWNELLTRDPSPAEIKEALFAIHADKAPGPDGFSASFFHSNWETIGQSIITEIQEFFSTGVLSPTLNVTHVRLIPKTLGAKRVDEYRPIALCNVYYKVISKLLSLRLKPILCSIISENQSAFIPGRAITDNVLITHEVLQFLKTSQAKKQCAMAVKMDMSKAYDRVEWEFIAQVMKRLGFHEKWINWIMQCITSVSYSYLINDSVYGLVKPHRGIRQGDPISPYLFILCGEVLSGLCRKAELEGSMRGVRVARGCPRVNHHKYKEDVQLMVETGLDAFRFSISWSRLIPNRRGPVNPKGLQFYKNFIHELVSHGIEPHVTLYHYDHPQSLEDEYGGWLNRRIIKDFTAYADVCFREFGNHVKLWTTINEANIFTIGGYDGGGTPPGRCSTCSSGNSSTEPYIVAHNLLLAHASASRLYKQKYKDTQGGSVGFSIFAIGFRPSTNSNDDELAIQRFKDFFYAWMLGPLTYGDYPDGMKRIIGTRLPVFLEEESELVKGSSDFVGVIHYLAASVSDAQSKPFLPGDSKFFADMGVLLTYVGNFTAFEYEIAPWAMEGVLEYIKQSYGNPPVYILENGKPMKQDLQLQREDTPRIEFVHAYMGAVLKAVRNGSDTRGYFVWSFMDLYELLSGYEYSFGIYSVNFSDPHRKRSPKLSAHWYSAFLKGNTTFLDSQDIMSNLSSSATSL